MGYEQRGKKKIYYYRKRREGCRVVSEYCGRDEAAGYMAAKDDEKRIAEELEAKCARQMRETETNADQDLADEESALESIISAVLRDAGYHQHRSQWRKRAVKNQQVLIQRVDHPQYEILKLFRRMKAQNEPAAEDVEQFRALAAKFPNLWPFSTRFSQGQRESILDLISAGAVKALFLTEIDTLKQELGYASASGLERLMIEHILTARVRLYWVEHCYTQRVCQNASTLQAGAWWDALLSGTHSRFLRAIETLARIRRLARKDHLVQFNLANAGGKQFIVGEMTNQPAVAPALRQQNLL